MPTELPGYGPDIMRVMITITIVKYVQVIRVVKIAMACYIFTF